MRQLAVRSLQLDPVACRRYGRSPCTSAMRAPLLRAHFLTVRSPARDPVRVRETIT
jgi:hypothetical protein